MDHCGGKVPEITICLPCGGLEAGTARLFRSSDKNTRFTDANVFQRSSSQNNIHCNKHATKLRTKCQKLKLEPKTCIQSCNFYSEVDHMCYKKGSHEPGTRILENSRLRSKAERSSNKSKRKPMLFFENIESDKKVEKNIRRRIASCSRVPMKLQSTDKNRLSNNFAGNNTQRDLQQKITDIDLLNKSFHSPQLTRIQKQKRSKSIPTNLESEKIGLEQPLDPQKDDLKLKRRYTNAKSIIVKHPPLAEHIRYKHRLSKEVSEDDLDHSDKNTNSYDIDHLVEIRPDEAIQQSKLILAFSRNSNSLYEAEESPSREDSPDKQRLKQIIKDSKIEKRKNYYEIDLNRSKNRHSSKLSYVFAFGITVGAVGFYVASQTLKKGLEIFRLIN